jgi:RNA dependent RNA polymerase
MATQSIRGFCSVLQHSIQLDDREWCYQVPDLPLVSSTNSLAMVKSVAVVSNNAKQEIVLSFDRASPNRGMAADPLDRFILISFADFRLRIPQPSLGGSGTMTNPATPKKSADYIVRLLKSGLYLNGVHYNFYGHSNSQLKSRSCVLIAASKADIVLKVNALGDFSQMKTVAKKAKRIGLLFSSAQMGVEVKPDRCEDIPDILTKDYIFTDGCGLISKSLANLLVQKTRIAFRNVRYTPSVYQLRYRGYKGVVMLDPTLSGQTWLKLRSSMKKFRGGEDLSFSVVDYSKVSLLERLSPPSPGSLTYRS